MADGRWILGGFAYLLVGWCGLVVPALIRSIEATHHQSDAEFGVYYLVFGLTYAAGSFVAAWSRRGSGADQCWSSPRAARRRPGRARGRLVLGSLPPRLCPSRARVGCSTRGERALPRRLQVHRPELSTSSTSASAWARSPHLSSSPVGRSWLPLAGRPGRHGLVVLGLGHSCSWLRCPMGDAAVVTPFARPGQEGPDRGARASPGHWASSAWRSPATSPPRWASPTGCPLSRAAPLSLATTALALYWAGWPSAAWVRLTWPIGSTTSGSRPPRPWPCRSHLRRNPRPVGPGVDRPVRAGRARRGPVAPMLMVVGGDRYPDRPGGRGYLTTAAVVGTIGSRPSWVSCP